MIVPYIRSVNRIYSYQYYPRFKIIIKNVQNMISVYTPKYEHNNITYIFRYISPIINLPTYGLLIPEHINQLRTSLVQLKHIPQWETSNLLVHQYRKKIPKHITYIIKIFKENTQSLINNSTIYAASYV